MPISRKTVLSRLIDAVAQPVYALDEKRRIVYCNAALATRLGTTVDELTGMPCAYGSDPPQTADLQSRVNALSPSPDVFLGQPQQAIVPLLEAGQPQDWTASFIPLVEASRVHVVLAVLNRETDEAPQPNYRDEIRRLRGELTAKFDIRQLIGVSPAIQKVHRQAKMAATTVENVLITGPPGSGREQLAQTIHYGVDGEPAPLVSLACQLLDDELLRTTVHSLLNQDSPTDDRLPTLVLTDADQLVEPAQHELLRLLHESKPFRVMVTATARGEVPSQILPAVVDAVSTITIQMPPLAARPEDVLLLAEHFLMLQAAQVNDESPSGFADGTVQLLIAHSWSGNVEELQQVVQEACAAANQRLVQPDDLPRHLRHAIDAALNPPHEEPPIDLEKLLEQLESELIMRALRQADSNKAQAARLLGINRAKLLRRIDQLGIRDW